MKRTFFYTRFLLLAGLLIFTGCDSNDEDDIEDITGSFDIQVTGDVMQSLSGSQAAFGAITDGQTGISGFGMTFGATGTAAQSLSITRKGSRPGNGGHSIANVNVDTEFETLSDDAFFGIFSTGTDVFYSSGGTLTITESTDRRIEGSISMTGRSVLPNATAEITVSGNFVAVGLDLGTQ